jgi:hypothetical protein
MASEPRDRSAPAKRRARERVGESEERSPSVEEVRRAEQIDETAAEMLRQMYA